MLFLLLLTVFRLYLLIRMYDPTTRNTLLFLVTVLVTV